MQWKALIAACARSSRPAAASRPTRRRSNCSSWQSGTPAFTGTSRLNGRLQSGSLPFCSAIVLSPQRAEGSKRWSAARHTQRSGHSRPALQDQLALQKDLDGTRRQPRLYLTAGKSIGDAVEMVLDLDMVVDADPTNAPFGKAIG